MANRLALAQSLYLRKHADNPINWWNWCPEALQTASQENKPIFLSIGYSSCHWCTVMEGEAFSNKEIADYMNNHFLPIKVDREERPDIDSIYMQALQMMTGQGGWPLNIFLTPEDLVPFYGGTYFPLEPRYGRRGFLEVLQLVRRFYDVEKEKLFTFKEEILLALQQSAILETAESNILTNQLLYQGVETNTKVIATRNLGYPSFPMIPYAELVLRGSRFNFASGYDIRDISRQRGKDLALGGIYDHVGGGFHRYTVDAIWCVPHFEKMLYDNGQIVEYLANLCSSGNIEPEWLRAIALTVEWLKREMIAPENYFYAAQDADSFSDSESKEPEEGAFYVWGYAEIEQLLNPEEFADFQKEFTVTPEGNFEGFNVLQRRGGGKLSSGVETSLDKLFAWRYGGSRETTKIYPPVRNNNQARAFPTHRNGRIPPVTDTKMIVAWNSLMISGLARAYAVLGDPSYWELATAAAHFILNHQWISGRFHRLNYEGKAQILAQSEDYALFIKALLDLQSASVADTFWLERAVAVQEEFDQFFWSVELGGYYNNATDDSDNLLIRERSYVDNATPSANGVAIANLVRLSLLTDDTSYLDKAEQALSAFSSVLLQSPQSCPSLLTALDWYLNGTLVRSSQEYLTMANSQYFPSCVYRLEKELPSHAIAIVCKGLTCLEPAKSVKELLNYLVTS